MQTREWYIHYFHLFKQFFILFLIFDSFLLEIRQRVSGFLQLYHDWIFFNLSRWIHKFYVFVESLQYTHCSRILNILHFLEVIIFESLNHILRVKILLVWDLLFLICTTFKVHLRVEFIQIEIKAWVLVWAGHRGQSLLNNFINWLSILEFFNLFSNSIFWYLDK